MEINQFIKEIQSKGFYVNYGIIPRGTKYWMTIFDPHFNLIYKFPVDKNYNWDYRIELCGEMSYSGGRVRNKLLYLPEIIESYNGTYYGVKSNGNWGVLPTNVHKLTEKVLSNKKLLKYIERYTGICHYVNCGSGGGSQLRFDNSIYFVFNECEFYLSGIGNLDIMIDYIEIISKLKGRSDEYCKSILKDKSNYKLKLCLPDYKYLPDSGWDIKDPGSVFIGTYNGYSFVAKAIRTDDYPYALTGKAKVLKAAGGEGLNVGDIIEVTKNNGLIYTKIE